MSPRRRFPPHVSEYQKRPGIWVLRYRQTGRRTHYFKAKVGTPEFEIELDACRRGIEAPKIEPGKKRYIPGTVAHTVLLYYGSPEFLGIADSTKATYRGILDRFCRRYGDKPIRPLETKHIKAILGEMADRPGAANKLLDRLKGLMKFAIENGLRKDNPTIGVKPYKLKGDGFHSWTDAEIARFEQHHAIGSRERLAFGLLLYTGQRRSDVVRMGWQHVTAGRLRVVQQKTGNDLTVPILPNLDAIIRQTPRTNLTFLMTEQGRPFTAAGFGNWFRSACDRAALVGCSAHGLRKAAARIFAEAGCTGPEIAAFTGHKSLREVQRYIAAADQQRLADQAGAKLGQGKKRTNLATKARNGSQNAS